MTRSSFVPLCYFSIFTRLFLSHTHTDLLQPPQITNNPILLIPKPSKTYNTKLKSSNKTQIQKTHSKTTTTSETTITPTANLSHIKTHHHHRPQNPAKPTATKSKSKKPIANPPPHQNPQPSLLQIHPISDPPPPSKTTMDHKTQIK